MTLAHEINKKYTHVTSVPPYLTAEFMSISLFGTAGIMLLSVFIYCKKLAYFVGFLKYGYYKKSKDILVIVIHACVVTENHILLPIYV